MVSLKGFFVKSKPQSAPPKAQTAAQVAAPVPQKAAPVLPQPAVVVPETNLSSFKGKTVEVEYMVNGTTSVSGIGGRLVDSTPEKLTLEDMIADPASPDTMTRRVTILNLGSAKIIAITMVEQVSSAKAAVLSATEAAELKAQVATILAKLGGAPAAAQPNP